MNDIIKLRKCPFCGGNAYLHKGKTLFSSAYRVTCASCGARQTAILTGLLITGETVTDLKAIEKAIDKWNNTCSVESDCN